MACYFIQAGAMGPVKIGHTSYPERLLRRFQTHHWEQLRLIRTVEGYCEVERWLHWRFAYLRIRGEWFEFHPSMLTVEAPHIPSRSLLARQAADKKRELLGDP